MNEDFLQKLRGLCDKPKTEDDPVTLTKDQFVEKILQEKNGSQLLQLLESGESKICERLGYCHGYIKDDSVYFDVPNWNTLISHLTIVNEV